MDYSKLSEKSVILGLRTVSPLWKAQYRNSLIKYFDGLRLLSSGNKIWDFGTRPGHPAVQYPQTAVADWLNDAVFTELAGVEDAWVKEAQLILIFGKLGFGNLWDKDHESFYKEEEYEAMKLFWGLEGDIPPGMTVVSGDLFGCEARKADFPELENVSCLSGVMIPRIDGLRFRTFGIKTEDMNKLLCHNKMRAFKNLVGITNENEKSLKGMIVIQKSSTNQVNSAFVNLLYDYLKTKPNLVLAGGTVPVAFCSTSDMVEVCGFLVFGEDDRMQVGCKIMNAQANPNFLRKQFKELQEDMITSRAINEAIHSVAFLFAPENNTFSESLCFSKCLPDTKLAGCTTLGQLGKMQHKTNLPDFIEFDNNIVAFLLSYRQLIL